MQDTDTVIVYAYWLANTLNLGKNPTNFKRFFTFYCQSSCHSIFHVHVCVEFSQIIAFELITQDLIMFEVEGDLQFAILGPDYQIRGKICRMKLIRYCLIFVITYTHHLMKMPVALMEGLSMYTKHKTRVYFFTGLQIPRDVSPTISSDFRLQPSN
mgnify:CR=1 FL=1